MSEQILNNFRDYLSFEKEFSYNTVNSYDRDLKKIFSYLEEKKYSTNDYSWLNEELVMRYIDYLRSQITHQQL